MLGIPKRNGGNGFLKKTCRTNLLSAVCHILGTSAAERLAAPLPTHYCKKLNIDNSCIRQAFSTFFCSCKEGMGMMQPRRNAELANVLPLSGTQASGREWRQRFHKRIKRHGFLKKTCRTNLLSAVCHILGTSAAERLAAPLPTHYC